MYVIYVKGAYLILSAPKTEITPKRPTVEFCDWSHFKACSFAHVLLTVTIGFKKIIYAGKRPITKIAFPN